MIVREFREAGLHAFKHYLAECRERPNAPAPFALLEDDTYTMRLLPAGSGQIEVSPQSFANRREAAEYFTTMLSVLPESHVANNAGLWTWLTLYFFDEVCPVKDGKRHVKNDYHYVFEPKNARHFYRHLLFVAWRMKNLAPLHNRLYLNSPLTTLDKVTTEVLKRLYVTRVKCIFEVLDRLYWDVERHRVRLGIVSPEMRPGDLVHRFPIRMRQLERTYDLMSLTADQLIELLGDEFRFSSTSTVKRRKGGAN